LFEHGVLMLLQYARGDAVGQMAIERLGRKHARTGLDVHPELYDAWLSCLVHVLGEVDPDFDDELRAAWIAAVRPGVRVFISMY
jgi:hemoglobin-like flavoprotein